MNNFSAPLQMPSVGGRSWRRRQWSNAVFIGLGLLFLLLFFWVARPRVAPQPIANLQKNGVHGVYNLHAKNGELLLFNFRAIEDGKLYRCSRLPLNHRGKLNGKSGLYPAAFFGRETFDFLRARDIRTVISLASENETYAMKGYFEALASQKNQRIRLINYQVPEKLAYSRDIREPQSGLRRAIQFIDFMKSHQAQGKSQGKSQGAVLVLGDSGKDAVGVVAAAYELWRNIGNAPADQLWEQVKARYLVSDVLIERDKKVLKFASKAPCKNAKYTFVCPETLDVLRPELERIAQMD